MFCPSCNAQLSDGSRACPVCGMSFVNYQNTPQMQYGQPQNPNYNNTQNLYQKQQPYPNTQWNQQGYYNKPPKKNSNVGPIIFFCVILFLFLAAILPALGRYIRKNRENNTTTQPTTTATTPEATPTEATTEPEEPSETIAFEEIYNNNGIMIKTTSYEHTSNKLIIGFYIENNSDLNINLSAHSYAVNDVTINNNIFDMYTSVTKGNKANSKLEISADDIASFDSIKNIELLFWIYDNDKSFKDSETEIINIETTETKTPPTYSGTTVYEDDTLSVELLDNDSRKYNFVLTNKSSDYFDFDVDGLSINGFTTTGFDLDTIDIEVYSGNQALFTIEPDTDFLNENGITDIEKIEFNIKYRIEGTYTNEKKTDVITYTLN